MLQFSDSTCSVVVVRTKEIIDIKSLVQGLEHKEHPINRAVLISKREVDILSFLLTFILKSFSFASS